ncbi:beta-N-acetylhexosaminidase [Ferrimonas gelatinilytica]|uniref:Beta-hexosaminidase n=1 Tax=Ferrimonas gelatinilytica TaxID=1255257 RepID=A0ABP9RY45_9GAMM
MGPVMADLIGTELTDTDRALLDCPSLGGLIFFSRNYDTPSQLQALIEQVRARRPELLLSVDHEGGRVQRFIDGFTRLPPVGALLPCAEGDLPLACDWAKEMGWLMAAELRAVDIDFSFAPVLDLNGCSEVIGWRAFAPEPEAVIALAGAYLAGLREAGMASVGKHFPGHGSVQADSHISAPVDSRSREALEQDMAPFRALSSHLQAIMPAHVTYPAVDHRPAGFSPVWIQSILRDQMQYHGVIFSDDLGMAGAAGVGAMDARAQAALAAGCDIALICNQTELAIEVAKSIPAWSSVPAAIRALRGAERQEPVALRRSSRWQDAESLAKTLCEEWQGRG